MNRKIIKFLFTCLYLTLYILSSSLFAQKSDSPAPSTGTYTNPIAGGEIRMGDPFVLFHHGVYYLYGTTRNFGCWRSENLVDWSYAGPAYQTDRNEWATGNFWAPEVQYYQGKFYMIYSAQGPDLRPTASPEQTDSKKFMWICLAVSEAPEGPFVDLKTQLFTDDESCIDGSLFFDKDGTPYVYFVRVGVVGNPFAEPSTGYMYGKIYVAPLSKDLTQLAGDPVLCVQADQSWEQARSMFSRCTEGPFVFKQGDRYYMTYSFYHYAKPEYGIGYATATSPLGPWTKGANNPLVTQNLAIGVSGPGHNSVTVSPDGKELFMVYHVHADPDKPGGNRNVNIDRLTVTPDGQLQLTGPTRSPQPLPGGAE